MLTTYQQTLAYLYANLPMFQRVGLVAYKKDLTNTIRLCELLGNPHQKFKSVHVAGTNGKGSTSHMLASVLQSAGYKTGLYTSPHLREFTERIKINGAEVDREFVVDFVNRVKPHIDTIQPSFFEITVAMAFEYFALQHIDVAVIEVGLGGRLDSTNVISPVLSVITNIGYDHQDLLGETLEKIAVEKAGIIKPNTPVVISERQQEVEHVFQAQAEMLHARLHFASDHVVLQQDSRGVFQATLIATGDSIEVNLPLKGNYQRKNLVGVLSACELLDQLGFSISKSSLINGLEKTILQTGLKGRWQKLSERPLIICDTGHNTEGMREVLEQIRGQRYRQLHVVLGMVRDKDHIDIFRMLPQEAQYYFCQARIPRAMDATQLRAEAMQHGLTGVAIPDVNSAIAEAKRHAKPDDFIFIGGSTFVVAEIENL